MTIQIVIVSIFFAIMGVAALLSPSFIIKSIGMAAETAAFRNEIRAVYGGFGIAIAGLLIAAPYYPNIKQGMLIAVAVSLFGMAAGRAISAIIEWPTFRPIVYFFSEIIFGFLLISSL